jgi:hypothetical protein
MVESHAATLPGTEIEYAQFISHALSDEQHRRYRILSNRSIEAAISNHVPRLVVLFDPHGPFVLAARNAGYRPVFALGRVTISERSQERF